MASARCKLRMSNEPCHATKGFLVTLIEGPIDLKSIKFNLTLVSSFFSLVISKHQKINEYFTKFEYEKLPTQ